MGEINWMFVGITSVTAFSVSFLISFIAAEIRRHD